MLREANSDRGKDKTRVRELPRGTSQYRRGYRWVVESRLNGKRSRKFFRQGEVTERDTHVTVVQGAIENLAKSDRPVVTNNALLEESARCSKILKEYGSSLTEATECQVARLREESQRNSTTFNEVLRDFLEEKEQEGVSERHYQDLRHRLGRFARDYGDHPISAITRNTISAWILGLKVAPGTKINYRRTLSNLFGYAVRAEFIDSNPVTHVARPKVRRKKIVILTIEECERLLFHTPEDLLPSVVLMLFCGVRNSETFRLKWKHVDWEDGTIEVEPQDGKRDQHARHVKIPKNALEWIRPLAKRSGPIADFYSFNVFTRKLTMLRRAAGWEPGTWSRNALRKTFISCHYESHGSIDETVKQAGNSVRVALKHYRKLIKKREADKLWELFPPEGERNSSVVRMVEAA
ncbi:MAG: tyrosine-type recombinase/integrase [Roseibacillus sp.]|nr:tyrosine-type recombinase/integrase [Roseibacillus sp.]